MVTTLTYWIVIHGVAGVQYLLLKLLTLQAGLIACQLAQ